ncbi:MAG: hypothetical protein HQ564_04025 [Candidatus Saganbacteria bacterium]|nr:hypothetical protein [Candidatus Saganbacteria bacterium]
MKKLFIILIAFFLIQAAASANSAFVAGYKSFQQKEYKNAIGNFQECLDDPEFILPEYARFFIAKSHYQNFEFASAEALAKKLLRIKILFCSPTLIS